MYIQIIVIWIRIYTCRHVSLSMRHICVFSFKFIYKFSLIDFFSLQNHLLYNVSVIHNIQTKLHNIKYIRMSELWTELHLTWYTLK